MDQVFITLDKMDKIGYEGVEKELLESGYCPESVSKYLDMLKNVTKDSAGVRACLLYTSLFRDVSKTI